MKIFGYAVSATTFPTLVNSHGLVAILSDVRNTHTQHAVGADIPMILDAATIIPAIRSR